MELWNYGIMELWNYGIMELWNYFRANLLDFIMKTEGKLLKTLQKVSHFAR